MKIVSFASIIAPVFGASIQENAQHGYCANAANAKKIPGSSLAACKELCLADKKCNDGYFCGTTNCGGSLKDNVCNLFGTDGFESTDKNCGTIMPYSGQTSFVKKRQWYDGTRSAEEIKACEAFCANEPWNGLSHCKNGCKASEAYCTMFKSYHYVQKGCTFDPKTSVNSESVACPVGDKYGPTKSPSTGQEKPSKSRCLPQYYRPAGKCEIAGCKEVVPCPEGYGTDGRFGGFQKFWNAKLDPNNWAKGKMCVKAVVDLPMIPCPVGDRYGPSKSPENGAEGMLNYAGVSMVRQYSCPAERFQLPGKCTAAHCKEIVPCKPGYGYNGHRFGGYQKFWSAEMDPNNWAEGKMCLKSLVDLPTIPCPVGERYGPRRHPSSGSMNNVVGGVQMDFSCAAERFQLPGKCTAPHCREIVPCLAEYGWGGGGHPKNGLLPWEIKNGKSTDSSPSWTTGKMCEIRIMPEGYTYVPATSSPTSSPTSSLFKSEKCDPKECDQWTCKNWCKCFKTHPEIIELFEGPNPTAAEQAVRNSCPSDNDECDCTEFHFGNAKKEVASSGDPNPPRCRSFTLESNKNVEGICADAPGGMSDFKGCANDADCQSQCSAEDDCMGYVAHPWGYMLKKYVGPKCLVSRSNFYLHRCVTESN